MSCIKEDHCHWCGRVIGPNELSHSLAFVTGYFQNTRSYVIHLCWDCYWKAVKEQSALLAQSQRLAPSLS
jgi:hypothetical protein